jgi:hypothetical protein
LAELEELMRPADHGRTARRRLPLLGVVIIAAAVAVALGQCKLVDERLTGVSNPFKSATASQCISQCSKDANAAIRAESELHVNNVKACAGDASCLALEEARHERAVEDIQAQRDRCKSQCHHQGGGSGGD